MCALEETPQNLPKIQPAHSQPSLLNNRAAWEALGQERDYLTGVCYGVGFTSLAMAAVAYPVALLLSLPPLGIFGKRLQKVSQIYLNMGSLLDEFESRGVIITPRLEVPENGSLDLFVRFPNAPKALFTIGFRSNGEASVLFREETETLHIRRPKRRGSKVWQIDLFRRFALQEFWLRKNRPDLFGQSSRDRNRPAVKLLVLTGQTRLGQHPEHLYAMIGDQKVLSVRNRVSLFIMEESQLIPFIKAWLAKSNTPNKG